MKNTNEFNQILNFIKKLEQKKELSDDEVKLLKELKFLMNLLTSGKKFIFNESLSLATNVCPTCGRQI